MPTLRRCSKWNEMKTKPYTAVTWSSTSSCCWGHAVKIMNYVDEIRKHKERLKESWERRKRKQRDKALIALKLNKCPSVCVCACVRVCVRCVGWTNFLPGLSATTTITFNSFGWVSIFLTTHTHTHAHAVHVHYFLKTKRISDLKWQQGVAIIAVRTEVRSSGSCWRR